GESRSRLPAYAQKRDKERSPGPPSTFRTVRRPFYLEVTTPGPRGHDIPQECPRPPVGTGRNSRSSWLSTTPTVSPAALSSRPARPAPRPAGSAAPPSSAPSSSAPPSPAPRPRPRPPPRAPRPLRPPPLRPRPTQPPRSPRRPP